MASDPTIRINVSNKYDNVPNGSAGLYLLGLINERQQKFAESKEYYTKALELNPTLWTAYEKLLKMGENVLPNKIFTENKYKLYEKTRKPVNQIRQKKPSVA
jgi:tetratricopeptide (TPR) repeat protein